MRVAGEVAVAGEPLRAGSGGLPVRFSDGTRVQLAAGAEGRVAAVTGTGADVVLERGRLHADVVHAPGARWAVRAGPFTVRVTGTRFTVDWSPAGAGLIVTLHEGAVVVHGGVLGDGVALRAGQRLRVDGAAGISIVDPMTGAGPEPDRPVGALAPAPFAPRAGAAGATARLALDRAVVPGGVAQPPRRQTAAPQAARVERWLALAEQGAHDRALRAAERAGFEDLCARLGPRHLLALGDVARYAGAPARARAAFGALVERFPDDSVAADATFSLGRLAFDAGRPDEAAAWFGRYSRRWPEGPLAQEAAGRLVDSAVRAGRARMAAEAARAYLERHPDGAFAPVARQALRGP
jgi:hypothetical protein